MSILVVINTYIFYILGGPQNEINLGLIVFSILAGVAMFLEK